MQLIKSNIERVQERIEKYSEKAGTNSEDIELVAVSKTVEIQKIQEAYDAGLRIFGESRAQEFEKKHHKLPEDIKWNFIGRLQSNKVKSIIDGKIFLLHSLDRYSLAKRLQRRCELSDTTINVLMQLNLSKEDTKSGVYAEEVEQFAEEIASLDCLHLKGVMTMAPHTDDEKKVRNVFAQAKNVFDKLANQYEDIEHLSMGMSQDYHWAILEGSNMVRVGSAIFGLRDYSK